ncbi:DUF2076 domain-containing protein [Enterobacteriaceae bacterium BIT-l23]|uniref:DUF2076 domain-containing protein n=1 Tax=Jejubacter sp. L23 TaxID=3092086 RepID=UPI0015851F47|nr:DUF2076 domain-containing protein [Enterobacteriaceae bacterium BIT-l23]
MQSEEQRLIDGLFDRLQQAQDNSTARDEAAESRINEHLKRQPAAPYYMAQTILIQEAAVKQLNARIQELESQVRELEQAKPASGGFLAGLFGGGQQSTPTRQTASAAPHGGSAPIPGTSQYQQSAAPGGYAQSAAPQATRGGGFMAGALQTAAGVAGGVVLGNMLTGMFQHSQPQEIVNIINEPEPQANDAASTTADNPAADNSAADNDRGDDAFQDASVTQDDGGDWMNFGGDDFGGDGDFGGDDDSWL